MGTSSTASGKKEVGIPAEKAGVNKAVQNLLRRNRIEEAEHLLDTHGVRYVSNSKHVNVEPSVEGRYSESASEIYMSIIEETGDDIWRATGIMTLRDRVGGVRDAAIIDDVCAITYDNSEWSSIDPSEDNLWIGCDTEGLVNCSIEKEEYNPNYGVAVVVNLPAAMNDETVVTVETDLTRVDSGNDNIPVRFEYAHTWRLLNLPWNMDISVGYGGLSVSLSGDASVAWDDHITAAPGEYSGPQ